jgi:hypothetical protein
MHDFFVFLKLIAPISFVVAIIALRRASFYKSTLFQIYFDSGNLSLDNRRYKPPEEVVSQRGINAEHNLEQTRKIMELHQRAYAAIFFQYEFILGSKRREKNYKESEIYKNYALQSSYIERWLIALKDKPFVVECPSCYRELPRSDKQQKCNFCGWPDKK